MKTKLVTIEDIRTLGSILSVWAHPDDETYTCAGIMAAAIENGQSVTCVTATRGEAGIQDESRWPAEHLAEIRTLEMQNALKAIGINDHYWLDYPDGGCKDADVSAAARKLLEIIHACQPDTILTFGPDGITGHPDHICMCHWVEEAIKQSGRNITVYHATDTIEQYELYFKELDEQFDIYFNLDEPNLIAAEECDIRFELPKAIVSKKYQALCAMPSQTGGIISALGKDKFHDAFREETFLLSKKV